VLNAVGAVCDRRKSSGAHSAPLQDWKEFTTADVYGYADHLSQLHPDNRNIKAKIRQQLQELRDRNLLLHLDRNRWRLP